MTLDKMEEGFQKSYEVAYFSFACITDESGVVTEGNGKSSIDFNGVSFQCHVFIALKFQIGRCATVAEMEKCII